MTYRMDASSSSVVIVCSECGWRALAFDRPACARLAHAHERRAHPGQRHAVQMVADYKRHAL